MSVIDFRARPNTIEYMDAFGLETPEPVSMDDFVKALIDLNIDRAVFTGRQGPEGVISNDYVAQQVARFPELLSGFCGVDPRTGDAALTEIERAINELGLLGVALDPPDPKGEADGRRYDDRRLMYPIYELADELAVPVILTLGPDTVRFGAVEAVDRIASDHPNLTIVCSHACWPEVNDWIALAVRNPNVVLEPSMWWHYPGCAPFFEAVNTVIQDQVVYASAFPFDSLDAIERFRKTGLDDAVLQKVTYENAARILRLG